jgi:tripartite-type tricarboxylate transporter receptor subunit TctC
LLKHRTGAPINHVPYRGGGPALNDVISGHIPFFFSNGSSAVGLVQAGTVKAIAHTGNGRLGTLPDLPAVAETLPGFEAYEWNGVFVPAATPPAIVARLNGILNALLDEPYIVERFRSLNVDSRKTTPDEFRAFVTAQMERWSQVVKDADIRLGN